MGCRNDGQVWDAGMSYLVSTFSSIFSVVSIFFVFIIIYFILLSDRHYIILPFPSPSNITAKKGRRRGRIREAVKQDIINSFLLLLFLLLSLSLFIFSWLLFILLFILLCIYYLFISFFYYIPFSIIVLSFPASLSPIAHARDQIGIGESKEAGIIKT